MNRKISHILFFFIAACFITKAQNHRADSNQISLRVKTDTLIVNEKGFLVIPLEIIKIGANNKFFYKGKYDKDSQICINQTKSPLTFLFSYEDTGRFSSKPSTKLKKRIDGLKILAPANIEMIELRSDTTVVIKVKCNKFTRKGILPTYIQFYYSAFIYKTWLVGKRSDGRLCHHVLGLHCPYGVIRRFPEKYLKETSLIKGGYSSNKVPIK